MKLPRGTCCCSTHAIRADATPPALSITVQPKSTPTPEHPVSIDVQSLNFYYGTKRALENISIGIQRNLVTAFIGPSGCGKSTFLRTLNRMNDIIAGTRVEGRSSSRATMSTVRGRTWWRSGAASEWSFRSRTHFRSRFSRTSRTASGSTASRASRSELHARVEESLKAAAIWDEVKDRLHDSALALSGGQQQRLCIARALAVKPEILLMDEPASALDPIATQRIEELIYQLKSEYTIVIVTHNMQQAARVSDHTAFFWLGGSWSTARPIASSRTRPKS